jgi:spore germination protein GerM
MQDQQNARRIPLSVIAGVSAALVAAGGGSAWWIRNSLQPSPQPETATQPTPLSVSPEPVEASTPQAVQPVNPSVSKPSVPVQPLNPQAAKPAQPTTAEPPGAVATSKEETAKVYWVDNAKTQIEVVPKTIALQNADQPSEILEGAFNRLLAGPTDPAMATTIPTGTKLRNLAMKPDGIHVDLSKEFTEGGGSTSMTARVAQIIYTATTLDPSAKVWIAVEGEPLEVLGGEGLVLDQPATRESFEKNFNL